MIKRLARLKNKKGTTLAEVLVALVVASILLGIAFGMMSSQTRFMGTIKVNAHLDSACDTVNEYVRSSVCTAKSGTVFKYEAANISAISSAAENYVNGQSVNHDKLYALMIRYPDPYQPHTTSNPQKARIYDFGPLSSGNLTSFTNNLNAVMSEDCPEELFYDDYYNNASFEMTVIVNGPNIKLCSQFRNPYTGELANQPRSLSFSMIGDGLLSGGGFGEDDDMGDGVVILYNRNDPAAYA